MYDYSFQMPKLSKFSLTNSELKTQNKNLYRAWNTQSIKTRPVDWTKFPNVFPQTCR